MVGKFQWDVLPQLVARNPLELCISHPGVKEERDSWPRRVVDYSYSKLNCSTLPLAEISPIQYGQTLDSLLR